MIIKCELCGTKTYSDDKYALYCDNCKPFRVKKVNEKKILAIFKELKQ